jgi:hypothetical protein
VPPAVILPGWVIYQGQKDKFSYAHPPDWKLSADAAGKTVYNLRAGGFWSALTDWTWSQGQPDDFAARIERQIADAGTYTGLSFSVLNKKPIGDSVHEGFIIEGELKSPGAGYWLNYAYLRSYHDSVLVLYYFREKSQANGGDPQTFAAVVASERDGDVAIVDKYP